MTVAADRSAAVLCAARRAVAGRRVLQTVLFLGGLLALGFLYGGQAHAAQSPAVGINVGAGAGTEVSAETEARDSIDVSVTLPSAPAPAASSSDAASAPAEELQRATTDAVDSVRKVTTAATRPVEQAVTEPVTDIVRHVAEPLTEPLTRALDKVIPVPLPQPGDGDIEQEHTLRLHIDRSADGSADRTAANSPGKSADRAADSGHPVRMTTGPGLQHRVAGHEYAYDRQRAVTRNTQSAPAQAPTKPIKPCDSTHGTLQQSSETHTQRKGDQAAAMFAHSTPYALVSGAGCAATEPPTRERARDILEFPG